MGGFSLGAITTLAAVNARPDAYSGAIVWEGTLYSENPSVLAANGATCASTTAALAAGVTVDNQTGPLLQDPRTARLGRSGRPEPVRPRDSPTGSFFLLTLTTPQPAPPAFVPDYTLVAGNLFDGFFFSSELLIEQAVADFNEVEPLAITRDLSCSLAGDRTFSGNLSSFEGSVFSVGAGRAFGAHMQDVLDELSSAEVSVPPRRRPRPRRPVRLSGPGRCSSTRRSFAWLDDVFRQR